MEKETKKIDEKNTIQEAHGKFLDTLGVDISGDYKRIIDVIAAIKSIDRIEKRSLSRKNIKEATKMKRMAEVAENYDFIETWLNEELEKEKSKEENEEKEVAEESEVKEENEADSKTVEKEENETDNKTETEVESEKENQVNEEISTETESENTEEEKHKTLVLAHMEKGKRFTLNKDKTLEILSNNIDSLLERVQTAKGENAKGNSGIELVKDDIYYDDVITVLKKHRTFVKRQMRDIQKNNEKDDNTVVILDGPDSVNIINEDETEFNINNEEQKEVPEQTVNTQIIDNNEKETIKNQSNEQRKPKYTVVKKDTSEVPDIREDADSKTETVKKANTTVQRQDTEQSEINKNETVNEVNNVGESVQQLDNWANQIVSRTNKGEKIEDILKYSDSTNSITEKIQKGDITINDAKKAINEKHLKATGKTNEKLVSAVEKYLLQRANSIVITVNSLDIVRKRNFWDKAKDFFKGIGNKFKAIFSKNKDESVEKVDKNVNSNRNEEAILSPRDKFVLQLRSKDGKKYEIKKYKVFSTYLEYNNANKDKQEKTEKEDNGLVK